MKPQNQFITYRPRNIRIRLLDTVVINDTRRVIRINRRYQQFHH